MRRKLIFIATPIIIILVVLTIFLYGIFFQRSQSTGAQYLSQCTASWPPARPGSNTSHTETVIAMTVSENTIAKICTEYSSSSCSNTVTPLAGAVYFESNMSKVPNSLISINAEPNPISAPSDCVESPVPIAYALFTLTIANSTKGFYMLELAGFCPMMPLAIGYSQIAYDQVSNGWNHQNNCSLSQANGTNLFGDYVSVNNIGVAYTNVPPP